MANFLHISSLITALILSVYAKDPRFDHIFAFEGKNLTIDCAGGDQEPILKYRKVETDPNPIILFIHDNQRDDQANGIFPRIEGNNAYYVIRDAELRQGGEYECDWSKEHDELNHFVNIVDKSTLKCPKFTPVDEGEVVPNLECSITKAGAIHQAWLNDPEHTGLDFTIVDSEGNPVNVVYEESFDNITAKVVDLKLTKKQNGTKLTCKFTDIHKEITECESNAALVYWPASGVSVDAPDMAVIGKPFPVQCDLDDAGNPVTSIELKIDGVVTTESDITATKEQGPSLNVTCQAGEIKGEKFVLLHLGPESVDASTDKIEAKAGDKMEFGCTLPEEAYPAADIVYKIGNQVVKPNATAQADYNGKEIVCTAINTVSKQEASKSIALDIKYAPLVSGGSNIDVAEELEAPVVLNCGVNGNPTPTYSWLFTHKDATNHTKLAETGQELNIAKLSPEDVGKYVCEATNEHGSATVNFDLSEKVSTGGNPAAIVIPILIVLIIIIAVIIAIVLMKKRASDQAAAETEKEKDAEDGLLTDENTRKDGPVQTEEDDKERR